VSSLKLAGLELRRLLTGRPIVAAAVIIILLVPLLYGALYLWAFWDPYAHVKDLPVAVVNEDVAAPCEGTTITAGADMVTALKKSGTMGWEFMSASEASAALASHRVYMSLRIPKDFSATLATADTSAPVRATLQLAIDEADSMLASQIGARVFSEVRAAASASAAHGSFDLMWTGFADAKSGMSEAATGAETLSDGLADASDGSVKLVSGTTSAHSGAITLAQGLKKLTSGAGALKSGAKAADTGATTLATKLAGARDGAAAVDAGAQQLSGGLATLSGGLSALSAAGPQLTSSSGQLADGAAQLDQGLSTALTEVGSAATGSHQLSSAASQVAAALEAYVSAHPDAASDPTFAAALAGSEQVSDGLHDLASGLANAGDGAKSLTTGSAQLRDGTVLLDKGLRSYVAGVDSASGGASDAASGAKTLTAGSGQLADGMTAAANGAHDLAAGTSALESGATKLAAGTTSASGGAKKLRVGLTALESGAFTLSDGIATAASGSSDLASGLTSGAVAMPDTDPSVTAAKTDVMSDAVLLNTTKLTSVANYGTGFAPYFIPLALWVGALVTFFLLRPISGRALMSGASDAVVALAGYLPAAAVGSLQAVIMLIVVQVGLGLTLKLPVLTYGLTILSALAFVALVQWLSFSLGSAPGKLAGIVLLMLQLTSAAGTFPIQTVPTFFQAIHPFLPMSYVVEGLRQTIAGGDVTVVARCALALAAFLVLGLAGTLISVHRQRAVTMARLRPALAL
jgi:putative membrane protein